MARVGYRIYDNLRESIARETRKARCQRDFFARWGGICQWRWPVFYLESNEYRAYTCRRVNRVTQISGSRAYLEVIDDDWCLIKQHPARITIRSRILNSGLEREGAGRSGVSTSGKHLGRRKRRRNQSPIFASCTLRARRANHSHIYGNRPS
jgi:hypothetical protein